MLIISSEEEQEYIESLFVDFNNNQVPYLHLYLTVGGYLNPETDSWGNGELFTYNNFDDDLGNNDNDTHYGEFYLNTGEWGVDPNNSHWLCMEITCESCVSTDEISVNFDICGCTDL